MEYAHWLIVAGAVLVVLGFIGFALHKNDAEPAEGHLTRDTSSETIQAALEKADAALASFCRETPRFLLGHVSYPMKPGQTDGGSRHSPGILTRFSMRFREAPVGTMGWSQ